MLHITIPAREFWDEESETFIYTNEVHLSLEHSLVSLSKWESKYHKPFLSKSGMTYEETVYYVKCMTLTQNVNDSVYELLTEQNIADIQHYIEDPMTATTFSKDPTERGGGIVTAEIIYYWMVSFNIPFECQKWHLNRLLTLIKVCECKNRPPSKRSRKALTADYAKINEARRKALNTKG